MITLRLVRRGDQKTLYALAQESGRCRYEKFIDALVEKDRIKLTSLLDRTASHGLPRNAQRFKHLEDGIYEFKSDQHRLLCFQLPDNLIVITHGLTKKKNRMPRAEIERAKRMRTEFLEAGGAS